MPLLVTMLLLLAVVGLASSTAGSAGDLPAGWTASSWPVAVVACTGWALALAFVLTRTAARPRWRRALRDALLVEAVLLTLAAFMLARTEIPLESGPRLDREPDLAPDLPDFFVLPGLPLLDPRLLVALVGVAVVLALLLVLWSAWEVRDRILRRRGRRVRDPRYGRGREQSADAVLTDAVGRARRALVSDEDVRRAVIAAYAAFEQVLRDRGAERAQAQTPGEYVVAALAAGTVRDSGAVRDLLASFHRARFSHEPMSAADRDRVLDSLDALLLDVVGAGAGR